MTNFSKVLFMCLAINGLIATTHLLADDKPHLFNKLQTLLAQYHIPGASTVLLENGKVSVFEPVGLANNQTGDKVRAETVFEAASLSKPLFAYIVLQLVDEQKIQLDKPIHQYFDSALPTIEGYEDFSDDPRYKLLTARLVLAHLTGLPNWRNNTEDGKLAFSASPGTEFTYSGEGFQLLQLAVETLTQKPLESLARERVFGPLAMKNSSYLLPKDTQMHYATGHNEMLRPRPKRYITEAGSAYSLHTTAYDYGLFFSALVRGEGLSSASHEILFSKQSEYVETVNDQDYSVDWGLGLGIKKTDGKTYFWHGGSNQNFKAFAIAERSSGDGLVYLSNSEYGFHIVHQLLDTTLGDLGLSEDFKQAAFGQPVMDGYHKLTLTVLKDGVDQALKPYLAKQPIPDAELETLKSVASDLGFNHYISHSLGMYKRLLNRIKDDPDLAYGHAVVYLRNGQFQEARDHLQKLLLADEDHEKAKALLEGLNATDNQGNTLFRLQGYQDSKLVTLAGTFNDWDMLNRPLAKRADGWQVQLDLPPGEHQYKFIVDGEWIMDPHNPLTGNLDGYINSLVVKRP